ncbi:transposase [Planctomicrobium sp. SH661]|uniref:transposase n=1 Tax=Planctomicrobium sp. SH661 TaxID=3448124 RepID=UPI003F5BFD2F
MARWRHRIEIHFLSKYAPQTNPIERVWWHLHETITRNHKCQTLEELIDQAHEWFEVHNNYYLDMRHSFAKPLNNHSGQVGACLDVSRSRMS